MTVEAKLLEQKKGNSGTTLLVEFTDDGDVGTKKIRDYKGSPADFVNLIRAQAIERELVDSYDFSSFVGQTIDITPDIVIPPPDPTEAEIARAKWFKDYRDLEELIGFTTNIPALVNTQSNALITGLRTSLAADFLISYWGGT